MKTEIKLPKGWELKKLEDGLYEVLQKTEGLEIGKDYIHIDVDWLVINRSGGGRDLGFTILGDAFRNDLICENPKEWREATKEEVERFFEKHLIERYGEDWKNVKLKDSICKYDDYTNEGIYAVDIHKHNGVWKVWNKNGCLFNGKEWTEVLEEKKPATDLSEIDRPYYIDSYGEVRIVERHLTESSNHMTSEELCEGILALQQLIAFRDNFHEVHGAIYRNNHGSIRFNGNEFMACKIYHKSVEVAIFDFSNYEQAKEFYETHKELFEELKKLY